eukprot:9967895-Karenia_brevis.AAC.1
MGWQARWQHNTFELKGHEGQTWQSNLDHGLGILSVTEAQAGTLMAIFAGAWWPGDRIVQGLSLIHISEPTRH